MLPRSGRASEPEAPLLSSIGPPQHAPWEGTRFCYSPPPAGGPCSAAKARRPDRWTARSPILSLEMGEHFPFSPRDTNSTA